MPSDIMSHVSHTTPKIGFKRITEALPLLDLDNLSMLNRHGKDGIDVFLTGVEDITTFPDWIYGEIPDDDGALNSSTACAVIAVEHQITKQQDVLDVFYFYFYSWNEGADITQVVRPLDQLVPDSKPGDHFGNHLGDWEHNMIRFVDEKPVGIYFSHHTSGTICAWDDETCLLKQGGRPIGYSARGSHANYPSEGSHIHDEALIDVTDKGRLWDPISLAFYYQYDPKTETFTAGSDSAPVDFLYFNGNWGDEQFPDSDPRQHTVPYFGLKKFINGPNGPKFKHLVREELMPYKEEKFNFMKTMVHWYLGLYRCCLKGINFWVVIFSLFLAFAATIVCCVFMARLGRSRLKALIVKRKERQTKDDSSEVQLRLLDPEGADADDEA